MVLNFPNFLEDLFSQNNSGGCFWELLLIYMLTQTFLRVVLFYGVVGIIHGGAYFHGFIASEKLKSKNLVKNVLETSLILKDYKVNF